MHVSTDRHDSGRRSARSSWRTYNYQHTRCAIFSCSFCIHAPQIAHLWRSRSARFTYRNGMLKPESATRTCTPCFRPSRMRLEPLRQFQNGVPLSRTGFIAAAFRLHRHTLHCRHFSPYPGSYGTRFKIHCSHGSSQASAPFVRVVLQRHAAAARLPASRRIASAPLDRLRVYASAPDQASVPKRSHRLAPCVRGLRIRRTIPLACPSSV